MPRVLEYLEDTTHEGGRVYRCLKCGHVVGPVSDDYKEHAGTFDAGISEGEPVELAPPASDFVLRHYVCPSCGILFEVDMVQKSEERFRSVRLA